MNNYKSTLTIIAICSILFSSCTQWYKTIEMNEVSAESLNMMRRYKPIVTIENTNRVFNINNISIEGDSIKGDLERTYIRDHKIDRHTFLVPSGQRRYISKFLHLQTRQELSEGPFQLPISKIIFAEVHEKSLGANIIASLGIGAGVSVGALPILLIIACNCPYVAVLQPDGTEVFQGSLFPGAMFKSLAREDRLILNNVKADETGKIEIKVFNELEEIQYLDKLSLLEISHNKTYLGLTSNSELISFDEGVLPINAITQKGLDVSDLIVSKDDINYNFDDAGTEDELNSVELTFDKRTLKNNAQLVIRGQQSKLLEQTAEYFFQQFGTQFPNWVERMNDVDKEKYNQNAIEQGISLNAYLKVNDNWKYIGSYENVGAVAPRDICLPLNLENLGEEIVVKLEAAHGFWNLDQVSITSDWTTDVEVEELPMVSAENEKGEDVLELMSATDKNYVAQANKGTFTITNFRSESSANKTYALLGTGYYNHTREYTNKPNKDALRAMKKMKYSSHYMARLIDLQNKLVVSNNK
ncbi:hypothetical protein N8368_02445 [Bacteroidia bacterium]|nr:hypothetical protein [Bacteroidia bacterium]MDB4107273.1 hypothetical protein [Bacteroidia bacterium]MDB9882411.1 hypothetical protein [Bacteroidia bacterium]MDC1395348.1 hypothetical protein [Bacteroidia bacterium]